MAETSLNCDSCIIHQLSMAKVAKEEPLQPCQLGTARVPCTCATLVLTSMGELICSVNTTPVPAVYVVHASDVHSRHTAAACYLRCTSPAKHITMLMM